MNLAQLSAEVVAKLVPEGEVEKVQREVTQICDGSEDKRALSGDALMLAGFVVQVCAAALQVMQVGGEFRKRSHEDKLHEVLTRIANQTGDPSMRQNERLIETVSTALSVLEDHSGTSSQEAATGAGHMPTP